MPRTPPSIILAHRYFSDRVASHLLHCMSNRYITRCRLGWCKEDKYGEVLCDRMKAVFDVRRNKDQRAWFDSYILTIYSDLCPALHNIIQFILCMRLLWIRCTRGELVESCTHARNTQELVVELSGLFACCDSAGNRKRVHDQPPEKNRQGRGTVSVSLLFHRASSPYECLLSTIRRPAYVFIVSENILPLPHLLCGCDTMDIKLLESQPRTHGR